MTDWRLTMREAASVGEVALPRVAVMSTWLTKRRAVDHCRVRSALCRAF